MEMSFKKSRSKIIDYRGRLISAGWQLEIPDIEVSVFFLKNKTTAKKQAQSWCEKRGIVWKAKV